MHGSRIVRNAVRCGRCQEVIESRHRHDFVRCGCKLSAVDGGWSYLRRVGWHALSEDLSVVVDVEEDEDGNLLSYDFINPDWIGEALQSAIYDSDTCYTDREAEERMQDVFRRSAGREESILCVPCVYERHADCHGVGEEAGTCTCKCHERTP